MKIKQEHYKAIKNNIAKIDRDSIILHKQDLHFKTTAPYKDLNKRVRWDIFYIAIRKETNDLITNIYKYANDDHIDTALRSIFKELNLN